MVHSNTGWKNSGKSTQIERLTKDIISRIKIDANSARHKARPQAVPMPDINNFSGIADTLLNEVDHA